MKCRHCCKELIHTFIDLGSSPPSNCYLTAQTMKEPEKWFPLKVLVCDSCWLVQTEDIVGASEMFSDEYAYFSSYSSTWLSHARNYVESMAIRFNLNSDSMVAEIAANDGYLLQYVKFKNIPCYGIEPTHSTATAARKKGIEIVEEFFGEEKAIDLVGQGRQADLIVANNVLAHVPDINDFVKGFSILLKLNGVATFEFPHLMNIVKQNQFDTIYHEHYSYLSLTTVCVIFESNGLKVYDVEEIPTHGGSLRVYAQRADINQHSESENLKALLEYEKDEGIHALPFYAGLQSQVNRIEAKLLTFLLETKKQGKKVVAYGAAAKGNTLLNYAGVRQELLSYVVDRNPAKQGKYMPGSRLPIVDENRLKLDKPDYVLILPWNLTSEITAQLSYINEWGGSFVKAIPDFEVLSK